MDIKEKAKELCTCPHKCKDTTDCVVEDEARECLPFVLTNEDKVSVKGREIEVIELEKVAEMLRLIFNDDCACNYNDNAEWLPFKCKYAETDCPMPKERLGCWKEFAKYYLAKMKGE